MLSGSVMVTFSVWLASGYAHVLILLSVVVVTLPSVSLSVGLLALSYRPAFLSLHCASLYFKDHSGTLEKHADVTVPLPARSELSRCLSALLTQQAMTN